MPQVISPELQAKLAIWKQKAISDTLTIEEMREAITLLRGDRRSASEATKRTKAKKAVKSADELLGELEGL